MFRSVLATGRLSDMANLSSAKSTTLDAAAREIEWEVASGRETHLTLLGKTRVFFAARRRWCVFRAPPYPPQPDHLARDPWDPGDWGQVEIGCFTKCEAASRSAAFRSGASMVPSTWPIERVLK